MQYCFEPRLILLIRGKVITVSTFKPGSLRRFRELRYTWKPEYYLFKPVAGLRQLGDDGFWCKLIWKWSFLCHVKVPQHLWLETYLHFDQCYTCDVLFPSLMNHTSQEAYWKDKWNILLLLPDQIENLASSPRTWIFNE